MAGSSEVMGEIPPQGEADLGLLARGEGDAGGQRAGSPAHARGAGVVHQIRADLLEQVAGIGIAQRPVGGAGIAEDAGDERVGAEALNGAAESVAGERVDHIVGGQPEAGIGGGAGVGQLARGHKLLQDAEDHEIDAVGPPAAVAGQHVFVKCAGDVGGFAASYGETQAPDAGGKIRLRAGLHQQAGDARVLRERVAETAQGQRGGERIVEKAGQRDIHLFVRGVFQGVDDVEARSGRVARVAGDERREDLRGDADRKRGVVVAKAGHGEPGEVIDGLNVLHEGQGVDLVLVGAEIETANGGYLG